MNFIFIIASMKVVTMMDGNRCVNRSLVWEAKKNSFSSLMFFTGLYRAFEVSLELSSSELGNSQQRASLRRFFWRTHSPNRVRANVLFLEAHRGTPSVKAGLGELNPEPWRAQSTSEGLRGEPPEVPGMSWINTSGRFVAEAVCLPQEALEAGKGFQEALGERRGLLRSIERSPEA